MSPRRAVLQRSPASSTTPTSDLLPGITSVLTISPGVRHRYAERPSNRLMHRQLAEHYLTKFRTSVRNDVTGLGGPRTAELCCSSRTESLRYLTCQARCFTADESHALRMPPGLSRQGLLVDGQHGSRGRRTAQAVGPGVVDPVEVDGFDIGKCIVASRLLRLGEQFSDEFEEAFLVKGHNADARPTDPLGSAFASLLGLWQSRSRVSDRLTG